LVLSYVNDTDRNISNAIGFKVTLFAYESTISFTLETPSIEFLM